MRFLGAADGATQEGGEPIDRGRVIRDIAGEIETAGARLRRELDLGEGERLLGQVLWQRDGLVGGVCQVPAMGEQIVESDLQAIHTGRRSEWPVESALEHPGPIERNYQGRCRLAIRGGGIVSGAVGTTFGRSLVAQE